MRQRATGLGYNETATRDSTASLNDALQHEARFAWAGISGSVLKAWAPCGNPALDGRDREPVASTVVDRQVHELFFDKACEHIQVNRLDSERGDGFRTRFAAGNHSSDRLTKRLAIAGTDGIGGAKGAECSAVLLDGAPVVWAILPLLAG